MKADMLAEIYMLPSVQGGRQGPIQTQDHKCLFVVGEEVFDCRMDLRASGSLKPGGRYTVPITIISLRARPLLKKGDRFVLRELHAIAEGSVAELLK